MSLPCENLSTPRVLMENLNIKELEVNQVSTDQVSKPRLLRIGEVCLLLGMSRSAVYREIYAGRLSALHIGERSLRVKSEEVERFISSREVKVIA